MRAPGCAMADIEELKKEKPELWEKFSALDGDFSGGLDKDELWCQLSKTPGVTEEFADQMISMIDTNGDGVIDFNECAQPPPASCGRPPIARVCD